VRGAIDDPNLAGAGPQELRPLVQLAADLRRSLSPAPAEPAQRGRVWARLAPRLSARRPSARPVWPVLRPAYALASLAVVVVLGLGTTTAYASEAALPGDVLYSVKLGLERAQLALSVTPVGDSDLIERFADRRVEEIEALTARGRWRDVEEALQAYPAIVDEMVAASQASGLESQAARLNHHLEVLTRVGANTPAEARPALLRALEHADRGRQEVERRRHEPKPVPPGQIEADDDSDRGPKKTPPGQERKDGGEE
jgi:hypothetical protein